jgi:ubiquinone/menaquinone biosynthesis C-methylase UbiE
MNAYDFIMRPIEKRALHDLRKEFVSKAMGKVLEIGAGTGVNLNYYQNVDLILTDFKMSPLLEDKVKRSPIACQLLESDVMDLPFQSNTFDTLVSTLVFCSVEDARKGLLELKRVLKDDGRLIFIEHVLPKEEPTRTLFNVLTPLWRKMASNCHLNRDYLDTLTKCGFQVVDLKYRAGTKFVAGIAKKVELRI